MRSQFELQSRMHYNLIDILRYGGFSHFTLLNGRTRATLSSYTVLHEYFCCIQPSVTWVTIHIHNENMVQTLKIYYGLYDESKDPNAF